MQMLKDEPSLEEIEDYDGKEPLEKRRTVIAVVIGILLVGGVYTYFKLTNMQVSDQIDKAYIMESHNK
jgi:hypothetical protein